jgi:hypothetical protein
VDSLHSRILPMLVLDTINCLWVAHDSVQQNGQRQARQAIAFLQQADVTDANKAGFMLLELAHHLREIESRLESLDRPFVAKKVRGVLDRVHYVATYRNFPSH